MSRRALNAARDGIAVTDARKPGNPIVFVNAAFERITGYSRAEMVGRSSKILQGEGTCPTTIAEIREAIAQRTGCLVTILNYRKDGTPFWNQLQISPVFDDAGVLTHYIGVQRDVSDVVRIREELEGAKKAADAANHAKSHFLASTSHEIRTALNGVVGSIELLLDSELDPEQLDLVRTARRACDSLLSVVHDVLDIAKIEQGKLELERVEFDPTACVLDACRILSATARRKGLAVRVDLPPDLPPVVGDPARVRQILLNLGNNAVKFTERGEIVVRIAVEARHPRVVLRASVRDTGVGMSSEQLERIFQPFVQADASVSRTHGGTGLGLAICKQLVEAMGGSIDVESVPGEGTTFTFDVAFDLPTARGDAALGRSAQQVRALVVDDNETNRLIARALLKKLGIDADVACNGLEAVDSWVKQRHELVLMDCVMPEMDGFAASREIRALEQHGDAPRTAIVALTGAAFATDRARCLAAGMDGFVSKPITREALEAAVRQHVLGRPTSVHEPTETEEAAPAVLDAERLRQFSSGDALFERRILEQFLIDARQQISVADAAAVSCDTTQVLSALHSIKGTAANVGAAALSRTAARAEMIIATSGCNEAAERIARVRGALDALSGAVEQRHAC